MRAALTARPSHHSSLALGVSMAQDCKHRRPPSHAAHHAHVQAWLHAPGSLTARLRQHGPVQVQVLKQGRRPLWPHEARVIGQGHGHVREVVLWLSGRPAVWARSVTGQQDARGPWRAIQGLGNRPLAEVLFSGAGIDRTPLQCARWARHSPPWSHRSRSWAQAHTTAEDNSNEGAPEWARSSVFRRRGALLLVTECFAPWMTQLRP